MAFKNAVSKEPRPLGHGEVHFFGDDKEKLVEFIDGFEFPERLFDESLIRFKSRITELVKSKSRTTIGREIIEVKWIGPLGYHQGYVDPR